jgi:hypothetical protein
MFGFGVDEIVGISMASFVGFGLPSALFVLIYHALASNKRKRRPTKIQYRTRRINSR